MKLLKSWNNYKNHKQFSAQLTPAALRFRILVFLNIVLMTMLIIISGCEEKMPTIQNPGDFHTFKTLTISADSMVFAQAVVEPDIGESGILYIGNDENVYAYSLLKFSTLNNYLPDSVEGFISLKLNLRSNHQYCLNNSSGGSVDVDIYHLRYGGVDPWAEDSNHVNNFDIGDFNLEQLASFTYSDSDTVVIELSADLIAHWHDDPDPDYTLVFMQSDTTIAAVQTFYSSESSYYPWLEISYRLDGDTLTSNILPNEDLSIIKFKKSVESSSLLNINSGRASFSVLKFNFEDLLLDRNEYIAKADLQLKIDPVQTEQYGDIFYLYVSLADSSILNDDGTLDPNYNPVEQSYDFYHTISSSDTVAVINLKTLLQGVVSNYIDNYGVVLYTTPAQLNIATLSLYSASDVNPADFRPSLHILTMKEQ